MSKRKRECLRLLPNSTSYQQEYIAKSLLGVYHYWLKCRIIRYEAHQNFTAIMIHDAWRSLRQASGASISRETIRTPLILQPQATNIRVSYCKGDYILFGENLVCGARYRYCL